MAFGFFKKQNTADIIYMNGNIYTQDPEFPQAEAVACREGRILAVGDFEAMEEIAGPDTEIIDLKEQYMFPGFIDAHDTPVLAAFSEKYLAIDPVWDLDTVVESVANYMDEAYSDDDAVLFGFGYNEEILQDEGSAEDRQKLLDEISESRPILLLGRSGVHCWYNTAAACIIRAAAEDEGLSVITADYILNILAPIDFDEALAAASDSLEHLTDKGFTTVFDLCSPDYFSRLYRDALVTRIGEGEDVPIRFWGSFHASLPLPPQLIQYKLDSGRTSCIEMDGMMTYDFLNLSLCDSEDLAGFSQEELDAVCLSATERGFNIHIDAADADSVEKAICTFDKLRTKGCRKNTLVLASNRAGEEGDPFLSTWPSDFLNESVFGRTQSVQEAIDQLTIRAAELIGAEGSLGSIEQGKRADFTVFEENPFDRGFQNFAYMQASLTVIDGQIVYDLDEACAEEMYNLMTSIQV